MRTYLACWQGNFGLVAFRGYLIRKLVSPAFETVRPGHFTWLSFVASSVLFGALHGRWLAGTLAGMAYAAALYRRGHVEEAVLGVVGGFGGLLRVAAAPSARPAADSR